MYPHVTKGLTHMFFIFKKHMCNMCMEGSVSDAIKHIYKLLNGYLNS